MKNLNAFFSIVGLLACLLATYLAYEIKNPVLGAGAILLAIVLTGFAGRHYFRTIVAVNLEKARTRPALRSGTLYWIFRLALMAITIGVAGFLYVSQNRADISNYETFYVIAGALTAVGLAVGGAIIVLFKISNPKPDDDV